MLNGGNGDWMRDVRFMSAKEKDLVLSQWERFVKSEFSKTNFTKLLYSHLIDHCSFIAHYDREGFYSTYFYDKGNTKLFIDQFTTGRSAEYGSDHWLYGDYDDINPAMCDVMREYAPKLHEKLDSAIRKQDLDIARALLAKHGKRYRIVDE